MLPCPLPLPVAWVVGWLPWVAPVDDGWRCRSSAVLIRRLASLGRSSGEWSGIGSSETVLARERGACTASEGYRWCAWGSVEACLEDVPDKRLVWKAAASGTDVVVDDRGRYGKAEGAVWLEVTLGRRRLALVRELGSH